MLNNSDIQQIRSVVREEVSTQLKPVNKRLGKIERYSKAAVDFLDRQNIDIEKRTERIENHLGLNPLQ